MLIRYILQFFQIIFPLLKFPFFIININEIVIPQNIYPLGWNIFFLELVYYHSASPTDWSGIPVSETASKRPRGRPRKHPTESDTGTVQALERGIHILRLLGKEGRVTLTNLALQIGMPPSTAHRLLMTLQNESFAEFDEMTQEWMIGVDAYRVGSGFLNRLNLIDASREVMQTLMRETGETANLAIPDAGDVVFINQVESPNPIRALFRPGTRSQMHASGAGKALLAEMPEDDVRAQLQKSGLPEFTGKTLTNPDMLFADLAETRSRGWSFDDEERYDGMSCIASPIFSAHGVAVAAISVSGPSARFTELTIMDFGQAVRKAAKDLTLKIGGVAQSDRMGANSPRS